MYGSVVVLGPRLMPGPPLESPTAAVGPATITVKAATPTAAASLRVKYLRKRSSLR
jgi:hypothetical protein